MYIRENGSTARNAVISFEVSQTANKKIAYTLSRTRNI